ncbi:MAG: hypothetical protein ACYTEQ_19845 [Planctomycetota bacterium]
MSMWDRPKTDWKGPMNIRPIDPFTISHVAVGIWLGQWFKPWECAVLSAVFELTENLQKDIIPQFSPVPSHDSWGNSIVDTLGVWSGAHLVRYAMRNEGLLDEHGKKTSVPKKVSRNDLGVLGLKVAAAAAIIWYGMNRDSIILPINKNTVSRM